MDWGTPSKLTDGLRELGYSLALDVCADVGNTKCAYWIEQGEDSLSVNWGKRLIDIGLGLEYWCWMNPPYGTAIGEWTDKAVLEAAAGVKTVALVPARPDTAWWWRALMGGSAYYWLSEPRFHVWFLKGRLRFQGAPDDAPFPSALIFFDDSGLEPSARWISAKALMAADGDVDPVPW